MLFFYCKIKEMIFDVVWAILMLIAALIVTDFARRFVNMESYASAAVYISDHILI